MVGDYIVPPRLAGVEGQLMQGDVLKDVPFFRVDSAETGTFSQHLAVLLTPTCDFALKSGHPERQLAPIEPIDETDDYTTKWSSSAPPRHLLLLPPLADTLPYGGIVHFRRAQEIGIGSLSNASRVATVDETNLRKLLAAHTTYYTRALVDPSTLPITPDDPRVLWHAIDKAQVVPGLADRRTALDSALKIAIRAMAQHHGISAPSPEAALVWLEELTRRNVLPVATRKVVRSLAKSQKTLLALYRVIPAHLSQREADYQQLVAQLEGVGAVLQERDPLQLTPQHLRDAELANLLRS